MGGEGEFEDEEGGGDCEQVEEGGEDVEEGHSLLHNGFILISQ